MFRIGQGFDIHKLTENRKLILGGVEIPYDKGLLGHSDADVLTHAIIDALLGALACGDIGTHFPDTDDKYKDINSLILLKHTYDLIKSKNYINNIDSTIFAQEPKLKNYIPLIKENLAKCLNIDVSFISIKAKTMEEQDSVGHKQSIAAQTVILVNKKENL